MLFYQSSERYIGEELTRVIQCASPPSFFHVFFSVFHHWWSFFCWVNHRRSASIVFEWLPAFPSTFFFFFVSSSLEFHVCNGENVKSTTEALYRLGKSDSLYRFTPLRLSWRFLKGKPEKKRRPPSTASLPTNREQMAFLTICSTFRGATLSSTH